LEEREQLLVDSRRGDEDVDEPATLRRLGLVDLPRGDRQKGPSPANHLRQPFGTAPGRHDAEAHLVETDLDVVGRDADVGGDGDFGTAAERVPVQRSDDRHGEGGYPVEEPPHAAGHADGVFVRAYGTELLEVATGHEGP